MCSYEKRIKHMKRKQSKTTYSNLIGHIITLGTCKYKIMVHSFAVSYFIVTYLQIALDRTYVLLA